MSHTGRRCGLLTVCLCAAAGWAALSPAAAMIPRRAALAASACARPASTSISIDSLASPVASPKATPVADVSATGDEPLNGQAITEIEQLVATVAACQTSGDYKTLAELLTPAYIQEVYGAGTALSVSEFVQFGKDLPIQSVAIQSVSDVRVNAKGEISADVVSVAGHQLLHGRWSFVALVDKAGDNTGIQDGHADGTWAVDGLTPLAVDVPAGAQNVAMNVSDKAFGPAKLSGKRGGDLVLTGSNSGKQDHELLVLRLPKSMTVSDLLLSTGPAFPTGVVFIGQVTIPAKTSGQLVLTDMPRGSYVVVDMLPDPDGIPYLSHGFVANLTIS